MDAAPSSRCRGSKKAAASAVLALLTMLALSACAPWGSNTSPVTTPTPTNVARSLGLPVGTLDNTSPPAGWQRLLNGVRFTSPEGVVGLAASWARPDRLAGCAQPAGQLTPTIPKFVVSDDGGQTWRAETISGIPPTSRCSVVADTLRADTFVVGDYEHGGAFATTDAGRTWRTLPGPDQQAIFIPTPTQTRGADTATTLVGGHLFSFTRSSGPDYALWETPLEGVGGASWQHVDMVPLGLVQPTTHTPEALAIDPDDPARIYVAVSLGAVGIRMYATSDGGQTWQTMREWPTAYHVALWATHHHHIFVQDRSDRESNSYQFFYSPDGGTTWNGIGLHDRTGRGESIFVGADGRITTYVGTSIAGGGNLFTLDPATGSFALLASPKFTDVGFLGIVSGGTSPRFIYADQLDTYALPLPVKG